MSARLSGLLKGRPPRGIGRSRSFGALRTCSSLAEPVRLPTDDDDLGVVEEAVEDGGGAGGVGQEVGPLLEGPVAGDHQAAGLVGGGHEAEEVVGGDAVEGTEAELVDDDRFPLLLCRRALPYERPALLLRAGSTVAVAVAGVAGSAASESDTVVLEMCRVRNVSCV